MHFPDTSPAWALLLLVLPAALLWQAWRQRSGWRVAALLLLLLQAASASSVVRLHYAHRYALPQLAQAPVTALAGISLVGGPIAAAGLALGWVLPGAPMHSLDGSYLQRQADSTDLWVGREATAELEAMHNADAWLDEDSVIHDMSTDRAMPVLAAARSYLWCSTTHDNCGTAMNQATGSIAAVVWANDFVSSELPEGPRETIELVAGRLPAQLGLCWQLLGQLQPEAGLYTWTCSENPKPWPDSRKAPRAPTWEAQGNPGGG